MSGRRWSDRWFRRGQDQAKSNAPAGDGGVPAGGGSPGVATGGGAPGTATAVSAGGPEQGPWSVLLGDADGPVPEASLPLLPTSTTFAEPAAELGEQVAHGDTLTVTRTDPAVPDLAIVQSPGDVLVVTAADGDLTIVHDAPDAAQVAAEAAADLGAAKSQREDQPEPQGDPDEAVSQRRAHLHEQYRSAWALGDLSAVQLAAGALLDDGESPAGLLHDLALVAVRRRRWSDAVGAATKAIHAAEGDGAWARHPSAQLLAVAAAATGDVDAASHAFELLETDPDPRAAAGADPDDDVWVAVLLNPPPRRPGETRLLLDDQDLSAEVVWARAESRLTARIAVVPTPASGHRLGDLVLLSPAAADTATLDGRPVPIVDELDRIDAGAQPTLDVTVTCPGAEDSAALVAAFAEAGATAQDWTATVRGLPGGDLRGAELRGTALASSLVAGGAAASWRQKRRFGLACGPELARDVLAAWVEAVPGRSAATPVEAC